MIKKISFKLRFCLPLGLCVSMAALFLGSCAEVSKDMGLVDDLPDIEQRSGPTGNEDKPAILDPFKTYNLVMAADECRVFQMKVPEKWFWKVRLTVVSPKENKKGRLNAELGPLNPPWAELPGCGFKKKFNLTSREGIQAVLGVGNPGEARLAFLRLCQQGSPLNVTIESQVSSTGKLMVPGQKEMKSPSWE
jgi:hypothetical protein